MFTFDTAVYSSDNGFQKSIVNEDGSVTITMAKAKHREIIRFILTDTCELPRIESGIRRGADEKRQFRMDGILYKRRVKTRKGKLKGKHTINIKKAA